jgi:hypothetical protein
MNASRGAFFWLRLIPSALLQLSYFLAHFVWTSPLCRYHRTEGPSWDECVITDDRDACHQARTCEVPTHWPKDGAEEILRLRVSEPAVHMNHRTFFSLVNKGGSQAMVELDGLAEINESFCLDADDAKSNPRVSSTNHAGATACAAGSRRAPPRAPGCASPRAR